MVNIFLEMLLVNYNFFGLDWIRLIWRTCGFNKVTLRLIFQYKKSFRWSMNLTFLSSIFRSYSKKTLCEPLIINIVCLWKLFFLWTFFRRHIVKYCVVLEVGIDYIRFHPMLPGFLLVSSWGTYSTDFFNFAILSDCKPPIIGRDIYELLAPVKKSHVLTKTFKKIDAVLDCSREAGSAALFIPWRFPGPISPEVQVLHCVPPWTHQKFTKIPLWPMN